MTDQPIQVDAYEAAARVAQGGRRAAVALPTQAAVAICQRLVVLEEVAADTFLLLARVDRLSVAASPDLIPETTALIDAIASRLAALGYSQEEAHERGN